MKSIAQFLGILLCISISFYSCKGKADTKGLQNIKVSELAKLKVDHSDLVIIDVRTPEEIAGGKIDANALEIDFKADSFERKINDLDRNGTYLVYCKSGGRSSKSANMMVLAGFKNVYNLEGGYSDWSSSKN